MLPTTKTEKACPFLFAPTAALPSSPIRAWPAQAVVEQRLVQGCRAQWQRQAVHSLAKLLLSQRPFHPLPPRAIYPGGPTIRDTSGPSDQRPRALGSGCPLRSTFVCCTDRDTALIKKSPGSSLRLPFRSPERHGWVYSLSPSSLSPHFL